MAAANADRSVIDEEVRRFDALGDDWWDPNGPMAPLHRLNPTRLAWLRDTIGAHVRHSGGGDEPPLSGLTLLDVGCGGGLLCEPLSRLGAEVVGLDPAPTSIEIARAHAEATGARSSYRVGTVEGLAKEGARFDVVLAMEVVEHVADVLAFVAAAASVLKPGGLFAAATLNRTLKSFALAIVGAEYVLRWLPPGTHHWEQFVTPDELAAALRAAGLKETQRRGVSYDPLSGEWRLSRDLGVNYFMAGRKG
jgi:2-polyprenyl-6-hydroxyphenyl methylase/3-demethylubiquinone-9 3-methyltransferase